MSDAAAPTTGHELLLGLAGWVDDDLLAIGRELVAVGEEAGALELLVASLAADRTMLPHPVRAGLADAVERRAGGGLARLLPPGVPLADRTAHTFAPDAGDADTTARIDDVVTGLTAVARSGARTSVTWRLTPAGAAPGPLPHPVVLLVLDDPAPAEVLAYQVGAALARTGVTASVEAFVDGAALPPYQRAALAAAGTPVRAEPPAAAAEHANSAPEAPVDARVTAGDLPHVATPTAATVTGPYERAPLNDPLETASRSAAAEPGAGVTHRAAPEDPSWSGPYAAVPTVGTRRSDDLERARGGDRGGGAPSVEDTGSTPSTGAADPARPGSGVTAEGAGPSSPEDDRPPSPLGDSGSSAAAEGAGSTSPGGHVGSASAAGNSGPARHDTGSTSPLDDGGRVPPLDGTGAAAAPGTGPSSPVGNAASEPPPDDTGTTPPERAVTGPTPESTDAGASATGGAAAVAQPPAVGTAGVDPARFDPARNAVDRTVHGGNAVTGRPPEPPANGSTVPGAGGPAPAPDAGANGHPSPRPVPRRVPGPAPRDGSPDQGPDDRPANGHPAPDQPARNEQEWSRQWGSGSWSLPAGGAPGCDPDIEPTTSPTPTTPPLSRVPPSPTRRSAEAADAFDADPDGSRDTLSSETRRRHRLDDEPEPTDVGEHAPPDVLDSRLTPNEQELLRRLQQELAAREGGSADQQSSQRNGTSPPPEQA